MGILLFAIWLLPPEMKFDAERWEAIVGMIHSGKLVEQTPGVVKLPPELANATFDGHVYIARLATGQLYLFKTMVVTVRPIEFRGYIYSTIPLDKVGTAQTSGNGRLIQGSELDWGSAQEDVFDLQGGLSPKRTIGAHWFPVSTCVWESN